MRKVIPWLLLLALLWSGWWWLASQAMPMGVEAAQNTLRDRGGALSVERIKRDGFPFTLRGRAEGIILEEPDFPLRLSLDALTFEAPTYWPGNGRLLLPETPIEVTLAGEVFLITVRDGLLTFDLKASPGLDLRSAAVSGDQWQVNSIGGNLLSGQSVDLRLQQSAQTAELYQLDLSLPDLSPGDLLRQTLGIPQSLPTTFDSFTASLQMRFEQPLDRHSLGGPPPLPQALVLEDLRIAWGGVAITAVADLRLTDRGQPEGELDTRIENWEALLELARAGGLPLQQVEQASLFLRALAQRDGNPETLSLPLRFEGGETYLDTIRLGPAPVFR